MASNVASSGEILKRIEELTAASTTLYQQTAQPLSGSLMIVLNTILLATATSTIHQLAHTCQEFSQEIVDQLDAWEEELRRTAEMEKRDSLPSSKVM